MIRIYVVFCFFFLMCVHCKSMRNSLHLYNWFIHRHHLKDNNDKLVFKAHPVVEFFAKADIKTTFSLWKKTSGAYLV